MATWTRGVRRWGLLMMVASVLGAGLVLAAAVLHGVVGCVLALAACVGVLTGLLLVPLLGNRQERDTPVTQPVPQRPQAP